MRGKLSFKFWPQNYESEGVEMTLDLFGFVWCLFWTAIGLLSMKLNDTHCKCNSFLTGLQCAFCIVFLVKIFNGG